MNFSVNRDFHEDEESLSVFLALFSVLSSLSLLARFLLFCIPGRRRTHFWSRLVLEARRGQRSGKRLSLRHCHTILPGPSLEYPCSPRSPGTITSHICLPHAVSLSYSILFCLSCLTNQPPASSNG